MPDDNGSENPNGQPQTGAQPGTGQQLVEPNEEGDKNDPGVFGEITPSVDYTKPPPPPAKKEETPPTPPAPPAPQPPSKDDRHAQTKINTLTDQKIGVAEKLLSKDPEAIYEIASEDKGLAESLLKRHSEYGASTVEELLENRDNQNQDLEGLGGKVGAVSKEVKTLKSELMEERISGLKVKHPDLKGDLEQEFRTMYNDPKFAEYNPEQLFKVVKALHGKESQTSTANDVGLDILKQQEGATIPVRGGSEVVETSKLTPGQRQTMEEFGHTEKDLEDFLPENIDDILDS